MKTRPWKHYLPFVLALWLSGSIAAVAQTPAATGAPSRGPGPLSAEARTRLHAQMDAVAQEKATLTPAQRKIASALRYAAKENATASPAVAGAPKLRSHVALEADGRVRVKMKANVTPELLGMIRAQGGDVQGAFPPYRAIYATVPLSSLETLAASADVEAINPPPTVSNNGGRPHAVVSPAQNQSVSSTASATSVNDPEGDQAHAADQARTQYGATGQGIKVGVLSDSVDNGQGAYSDAQLNGYVPTVNIIPGQAGSGEGEGLAMLEVVHRLAPDATLYFATGATGNEQMAMNIEAMAAAGCQVIIDDEFYSDEDPFQDATIAQAVDTVSAQGVLYFSCSANYGNLDSGTSSCWEGDFKGSTDDPTILDFAAGTADSPQELNGVTSNNDAVNVLLFWSEPLGGATSAYSLYEVDDYGDVIQEADATGKDPSVTLQNVTPSDNVAVEKASGSDRFLHLDIAAQNSSLQFATAGRARGHNACGAANAFCVAATPAAAASGDGPTGPYPNVFSSGNQVETFSDDGPRRIFFNPDGSAITPGNFSSTGGKLLAKPDFTAADGVSTNLPLNGGLNPFFGTSCATPHAGAIAALLLSYKAGLTPAQVGAGLRGGTVQITNPGPGDRDSGAGILLATSVLQTVNTPPSIITFSPANGPAGTLVTVTGINLRTTVAAAFNGVAAPFSVVSGNAVTVNVPAGATTGPITLLTAGGTATSASNFTLTASVSTPVVSSVGSAGGQVGAAFSYQITATNGPTSFGAAGLPAGLGINAGTGLISGIPAASGTFTATISAGNAAGGSSSATLTLTILPAAPVLTNAAAANGQVGVPFGFQIAGTNAPTSYSATGLPAGLILNPANGFIGGTPAAPGTFAATVSATNAGGTGSRALLLTILPAAPVVSSASAVTGRVGVPFGFQLAATNGPTSFGAAGLPAGLTLNAANGFIGGTPVVFGTFPVAVSAANAGGTGHGTLTLHLLPAIPVITSARTASAQLTVPFSYNLTASSAPTSYAAAGLPAGLSLNPATGVITGTPTVVGTYAVTLSATNAGGTGQAVLTLTVAPPPEPTVTLSIPVPSVTVNSGAIGEFLLTLSAVQTHDVIVVYTLKGSGVNGTDYVFLKGTAKLKAGKTSKPVKVTPLGDLGGASKKTVKLTLGSGDGYILAGTVVGKVKILAGQ